MRYSVFVKAVALVLAACGLTVAVVSGLGIAFAVSAGLYGEDYDSWYAHYREAEAERLATALAESYATRALGGFTRQEQRTVGWGNDPNTIGLWRDLTAESWCYTVARNGLVCETNYSKSFDGQESYRFELAVQYPQKVYASDNWDESYYVYGNGGEWVNSDATAPTVAGSEGTGYPLYIRMETSPQYTVSVYFMPDAITQYGGVPVTFCAFVMRVQYILIGTLACALLVAAACLIWLAVMAGRKDGNAAVEPGGLNRLPLDIYAVAVTVIGVAVAGGTTELFEEFFRYDHTNALWLILGTALLLAGFLCVTGFLFALAAQAKLGFKYLWKRTLIGWCAGKLWRFVLLGARGLAQLYSLLPLIWKYLLTALAMAALPVLFGILSIAAYGFARGFWLLLFFAALAGDVLLVLYGAYAYGTLLRGAKKMAAGELHTKVDTGRLYGTYKDCGENLNALAEVSVTAAKNQMKSERMKAELITNVSHDIKTPLTSIINYIDLLQKAETEQQRTDYLQVLDRQSQRLKKLIEDLMDMSKASTGNLSVDVSAMDAVEAVNQALGEFADKFKKQGLTVMFDSPGDTLPILADGKLTWRVLSNILGNAVKYALPGTRVYVDLTETENTVAIHIKNISKEPLNISADELMERFVRGDASRNTEGSGLGLNIAQSLMQLQNGSLQLTVDGDLFKTVLQFPKVL